MVQLKCAVFRGTAEGIALRIASALLFVVINFAQAADVTEQLPASTRLVMGVNVKTLIESPLVRPNAERLKNIFNDWTAALVNLGIEPTAVERIWIAAGDGYPSGTAIVITGKIDPGKVEAKFQEHIKKVRFAVRPFREGTQSCFSLETPVGMNAIPGLSPTLFVAARNDSVIVTFDQGTLQSMLKPIEPAKSAKSRFAGHQDLLERASGLVGVFKPHEALTANGSMLAGVGTVEAEANAEFGFIVTMTFRCDDAASFQPRLKSALDQAKQLFGPLAVQQGVDPKLTQFVQELLNAAKFEVKDKDILLTAEMSADQFGRIIKK